MTYGFILAAGNQTRFMSDIPKALVPIDTDGTPLLHHNITMMQKYCDKIFVVCSLSNHTYFVDYCHKYNDVQILTISSGLGCGDAVLKALNCVDISEHDKCFIQWGDSIQTEDTYDAVVLCQDEVDVIIPCILEELPYVQIIPNGNSVKALFSKFGDKTSYGYHDLSLFYGSMSTLKNYLSSVYHRYFNGTSYNMRNNEFSFLDVFNYTDISASIVDIKLSTQNNSFNTEDELAKLISTNLMGEH